MRDSSNSQEANPSNIQQHVHLASFRTEFFQSILPSAEELSKIEAVIPGGANRYFTILETQTTHRQSLEQKVIDNDIKSSTQGRWTGFTVTIAGFGVAVYFINHGLPAFGISAFFSCIVALVTVFVIGKKKQNSELSSKDQLRRSATTSEP